MAWMPRLLVLCCGLVCWAEAAVLLGAAPPTADQRPGAGVDPQRRLPIRIVRQRESEDRTRPLAGPAAAPNRVVDTPGYLSGTEPIPLPPPVAVSEPSQRRQDAGQRGDRRNMAMVVTSSLAIVLGLFFLVLWLSRRGTPKAGQPLPTDALEILGRTPLAARHNLQLIRLGHHLLLVSVSPDTARTLLDITDVDEVNHLIALCRQDQPGSITASFRQVLQQMSHSAAADPLGDSAMVAQRRSMSGDSPARGR